MESFDRVWLGGRLATLSRSAPGLGLIEGGAVAARDGRIAFVGPVQDLPTGWSSSEVIDLEGRLVTPGLIDCHTHLVFGGDRADEFEMRRQGASYEEIAAAGGGILSTVRATRKADDAELHRQAADRLDRMIAEGVTTVEIKSGYGLDEETELRILRVARALGAERPVEVATTLLAAHTFPPEFKTDRQAYVRAIVERMIPAAAAEGLADAVDAFLEPIAFSPAEVREVFTAAKAHGLPVKLHADQLTASGGAALAAEFGALSADHLEWTDAAGIAALAKVGTVAVLLPGAFFNLREGPKPPVEALRKAGVAMAVATDCNPGTSPIVSLQAAMTLAAVQFRMTVEEIVAGVTREAAKALGQEDWVGTLEVGKACDLAIWNVERPAELVYWLGRNNLFARVWRGR
ncbi:MAG TPA: imidazolonepropionase [Phenylobacterium sp.]